MKKIIFISLLILSLLTGTLMITAMSHGRNKECNVNYFDKENVQLTSANLSSPSIGARAAYLTDSDSGRVLYAKSENERYEIASMVKIMTALLVLENIDNGQLKFDEMITISHNAAIQTGSELFVDEGKQYSVHDLLKGVIVVSANDASVALAERIAGSEDGFVAMMNERAIALQMNDTVFANPTGLPQGVQYSTARDVNRMTRELLKHKDYYKYSSIWLEDYTHPSGRITQLANTNKLIRFYKGCDSGKTGFTNNAKFCLSASASRNEMRVVATLLGGEDSKARFRETSSLFDYAFANYKKVNLLNSGDRIDCSIKLIKASKDSVTPITSRKISVLLAKGEDNPRIEYDLLDNIPLPIKCGDVLGVAKVMVGNSAVDTVELVSAEDISKASYWDYVKKIVIKQNKD